MKKTLLAMVLTLALALSLLPSAALAAAGKWTDHATVGWGNGNYTITSAEDLAAFAAAVNSGNNFENTSVTLAGDISLGGYEWVPIGTQEHPFSGTFDGGGNTISYMTVSSGSDGLAGLFGFVKGAEISGVFLENAVVTAEKDGIQRAGILAGWMVNTQVEDVAVSGDLSIQVSGDAQFSSFGGMIGLADYGTTSLSENKSALTACVVSDVEVQYQGSANTSYSYETSGGWGATSYYYLPISIGGLVGAQGNPYSTNGHYGCGTTINSCTVTDLRVTRSIGDGSVYEAIGGIIGTARTQAQIQDCEVAGFVADVSATIPGSEVSIGSYGDLRDVLAGIYLGGVAGIFDGDSQMLRCSVIESEAFSDVTGGYEDMAGKSGGFYGGLAGMLGFPPGWTDDGRYSEQAHFGGRATIKSCYCEMSFKIQNDESVRYVSSVRSLGDGEKIEVQYVVCNTSGVTVTNADYDFVCGLLEDSGSKKTELIQSQIHPVRALEFEIRETKEPFDYWYRTEPMEQASISNLSAWNDHIEDLSRSYTASEEVLSDGNGTERLTFSKAGTHDVTVIITDPEDDDIKLVFTLPVTVKEAPSYTISASPAALDFGSAQAGYTPPEAKTVTITNTGNQAVEISLPALADYTITSGGDGWTDGKITLQPNGTAAFTVRPNAGLPVGAHNGAITVKTGNGASTQITVSFTVTAVPAPDPGPTPGGDPGASGGDPGTSGGGDTADTPYVRFDSNGGTAFDPIAAKDPFTLDPYDDPVYGAHIPTRPGYRFTGWYRDRNLTLRVDEDRTLHITGAVTLFAGWEETSVPDMLNGDDHFAYIQGYADGSVRPNANITRAQVATIFFRLLDEDVRDDSLTTTNPFPDVDEDYWANTAISTMAALGVINGRNNGNFDPDASITRAEFAAICARFDDSGVTGVTTFTDTDGHWAEEEIGRAAALGWIQGYSGGTFRPNQYITRAQAVTMINRVLCRLPEDADDLLPGMNTWTDCREGDWYYLAIQEATNSHDYVAKDRVYETWTSLNADPDWSRYE